ncbi:MAG: TetR/AcrR family transcriptional regulator [Gemmatimonadota bacterium]|nr:TetR/AcrR family transcriptional regulator [Gemmatimonadota bacterium]MDH5198265.1 TetR/AcrR family transcriptional regulator [Gemmatimonadota bacterium]
MSVSNEESVEAPPAKTSTRARHTPDGARREITSSAVRFLWEHPFRDLTISELMAGTTLSRPAFYQYFHDLHELLESLLREVEEIMHQTANPWIAGEGEPIAALRESLAGVVQTCVDHGPIFRAVAEAAPLDARLETAWSAFMGRWDDAVSARIAAQQAAGVVRAFDARRMANALNALDAAVLLAEFGAQPQGDPEAVLDTLHAIWVGALYGCAPTRVELPTAAGNS